MSRHGLGLVAILLIAGGFLLAGIFSSVGDARMLLLRESALAGQQADQFRHHVARYSEGRMA